jgi:hypothetical protein
MEDMRKGHCALCRSSDLCRVKPTGLVGTSVLAPLYAHHDNRDAPAWRANGEPFGELSAVLCRTCGFLQWFVDDPAEVPLDAPPSAATGQARSWGAEPDADKKPDEGPYR